MPTPSRTRNAAATAAINKVVGASTAATLDTIDRQICSQPNCSKCRHTIKAVQRWKPRIDISDVYDD